MKRWKKPISAISAGLLITGVLFTSSVDASQAKKKIEAHYQNIKIVNNGLSVTIDPQTEPFIVNGTTYIPLKMMGELYNKNIVWNGATHTITVTDKTQPINQSVVTSLTAQIAEKNAKITQLQAELDKLKAEQTKKNYDLDDLEAELNDDYGDYNDIDDIEIFLSGDEDDIDVRIDVNATDWKNLTDSKKKGFLQDIIDDILDEFDDADIKGTIKNEKNGEQLATFDTDSNDKVRLVAAGLDLDDLEDELNDDYDDYYADLDDVDITLSGNKNNIDIIIEVEGDDWKALAKSKKLNFLQDIADDILREFKDAFINGVIKDDDTGSRLDTFYADGDDDGDVAID